MVQTQLSSHRPVFGVFPICQPASIIIDNVGVILFPVLPQVPPASIIPEYPDVFQVHFAFERVLSNVMEMKVTAELAHGWKNKIHVVEVSVVSSDDVRRVMAPSSDNHGNVIAYFTFSDLQRVQVRIANTRIFLPAI